MPMAVGDTAPIESVWVVLPWSGNVSWSRYPSLTGLPSALVRMRSPVPGFARLPSAFDRRHPPSRSTNGAEYSPEKHAALNAPPPGSAPAGSPPGSAPSAAPAPRMNLTRLVDVVPRTIESSTTTTRWPARTSRTRRRTRGMTLLTRQLAPGPEGVPIEIYCFSNDTAVGQLRGVPGGHLRPPDRDAARVRVEGVPGAGWE